MRLELFFDKRVTICIIKLDDRPFHVAMATTQIKGFKNDILQSFIHKQLKVGCFLMKMLKFERDDVIIYGISGDFGIFWHVE